MSPTQVNSIQQPAQSDLTGQAKEPRRDGSFRGRLCGAAKRVVNNLGACSAYVAAETAGCAAFGYYMGRDDSCASSMAYAAGVIGGGTAVAACLVCSYLIECVEQFDEKTSISSKKAK